MPDNWAVENCRCENACECKRDCNDVRQAERLTVDFAQDDKGGSEDQRQSKHLGRQRVAAPRQHRRRYSVKNDKPGGPLPPARAQSDAPMLLHFPSRLWVELQLDVRSACCNWQCESRSIGNFPPKSSSLTPRAVGIGLSSIGLPKFRVRS